MPCPLNELTEHYPDIDTDHSEHYMLNWRTHPYPMDALCNLLVYRLVLAGMPTQSANERVREMRKRGTVRMTEKVRHTVEHDTNKESGKWQRRPE